MTDTTQSATADVDLFSVAHDLLSKAAEERAKGNAEAANKLLAAAGNIMGQNNSQAGAKDGPPNGTQQVADLLSQGWHEVSEIVGKIPGMTVNRVHVIIGRLKAKGKGLESQSVKRYRIYSK